MSATTQQHGIAIIDDDAGIVSALAFWLKIAMVPCATYASVEAYLQQIDPAASGSFPQTRNGMVFYGLIADMSLPGANGLQLLSQVRQEYPQVVTVLITALDRDERERMSDGDTPGLPVQCLTKPFDLDALERALAPALAQCAARMR